MPSVNPLPYCSRSESDMMNGQDRMVYHNPTEELLFLRMRNSLTILIIRLFAVYEGAPSLKTMQL